MVGRVENLLAEILEELRLLRKQGSDQNVASPARPLQPFVPPIPSTDRRCPLCSIRLEGVMGFACSQPLCPVGLGPVTCRVGG